jgi:hypothetical protein
MENERLYTEDDMLSFAGFRLMFSNPKQPHFKTLLQCLDEWKKIHPLFDYTNCETVDVDDPSQK